LSGALGIEKGLRKNLTLDLRSDKSIRLREKAPAQGRAFSLCTDKQKKKKKTKKKKKKKKKRKKKKKNKLESGIAAKE